MNEQKALIFQVDDDRLYIKSLPDFLKKPGHKILLTAGSVAQALRFIPDKLLKLGINVAILDNTLPDGNGLEIATKIRETIDGLSIVCFSADENLKWGDYSLLKPADLNEIRATIQRAIPSKPPVRKSI